jgi:hypothetical protein
MDPIMTDPGMSENFTLPEEPETSASGSSGSEALHYSTESPVKEIPHDSVENAVGNFATNISKYEVPASGRSLNPRASHNDWKSEGETLWNERNESARMAAHGVKWDAQDALKKDPASFQTFKYDLGRGHTAAVMGLKHSESGTEVSDLASHPGAHGAGKTMIEKAVNKSTAQNGKLSVRALPDSVKFYKSVGFQETSENETRRSDDAPVNMHLDPSKSDKWSQGEDGNWSLKELEGKKYGVLPEKAGGTKRPHEEEVDNAGGESSKRPRIR